MEETQRAKVPLYILLGLSFLAALVCAISPMYHAMHDPTGVMIDTGNLWTVTGEHGGGAQLEVEKDGKKITLNCVVQIDYKEDKEYSGCYPYRIGEAITLEKWCKNNDPLFVKKMDDGSGEYQYGYAMNYHDLSCSGE